VSLHDLKTAGQKSESQSAKYQRQIKQKLDEILQQDNWVADDIFENYPDHDYAFPPILDCIIYYVTGSSV